MTLSIDFIGFPQRRSNPEFYKRACGKNFYAMNVKDYDQNVKDM
jgi:hypothetical protein